MANAKKIVILGGGYAGVHAGRILEKHFRKNKDVEITLIDKHTFHTLMTELHEVAGHRVEPESVQVPFRKIFGGRRIEIANDTVNTIDFEKKLVFAEKKNYEFDYLIVGAGAEPEYFGIPGIREHSFSLWSFEDALVLRHHLEETFRLAETELDPEKRKKLLTFVVAGAGFTGIEILGELLEYRDVMCRKYYIDPSEVRVVMIEALDKILPILEEPLRKKAAAKLAKMKCEVMLGVPIDGAEEGRVLLKNGTVVETETFIWTCGVMGARFTGMLALTKGRCANRACEIQRAQGTCGLKDCQFIISHKDTSDKRGRALVDAEMRSVDYPNVFVVGDNNWFLEDNKPLPQIVETAEQTAAVAAHNIVADIEGKPSRKFKSNFHGFMICIGSKWGVSNAMGMLISGFFALVIKHLINVYYLFGIAGFNQCWEYLKHEFLDIRERRSLIGGFASYKTRAYWPLLLRLWLGFMWVVEATNKMTEGWLNFANGSKTGWMFSPNVVQAGIKAVVDAGTAATGEEAVVEQAVDATVAASGEAVAQVAEAVKEVAKTVGPWFDPAKPIIPYDSGFVTWFRQTFMDGIFSHMHFGLFQIMIVFMELFIGLALFGGFFTWWAAVASIAMCFIFTFSGMFAWNQAWFIFAAVLMMGGAGRSFGLDYWSVPFFKKWWNGRKWSRKHHFYLDQPSK